MSKTMLKSIISSIINEITVEIPKRYKLKEQIKNELQALVTSRVINRRITSQDELEDFFKTCDMALRALRQIPYKVYEASYYKDDDYNTDEKQQ